MNIKIERQNLREINRFSVKDRTFTVNGKVSNYDIDKFVFILTDLVSDWPEKLEDDSIIDGSNCAISIKNDKNKKTFIFRNKFPKDFYKLTELLDEVVAYDAKTL